MYVIEFYKTLLDLFVCGCTGSCKVSSQLCLYPSTEWLHYHPIPGTNFARNETSYMYLSILILFMNASTTTTKMVSRGHYDYGNQTSAYHACYDAIRHI